MSEIVQTSIFNGGDMEKRDWKTTVTGFDMFEIASTFQKALRRGDEKLAMLCGTELMKSDKEMYAFKRLMICATEDCEVGQGLVSELIALRTMMVELLKKNDNMYEIPFVNAIITVSRAKKSRVVDWAKLVYLNNHNLGVNRVYKIVIPDYALDIHTRRGKIMGKKLEDFYSEGSILIQPEDADQPTEEWYKEEAYKMHERTGHIK